MGTCTQDCRAAFCDYNEVRTETKTDNYDSIRQSMPLMHLKLETWIT